MKNPKFSIIIPVYNVQEHIKFCLDSILSGTYSDYEIICVNDGSTDDSAKILEEYKDNPKIKIIHKENGGLSSARNCGMEYAEGEYIVFIDSDDFVHHTYLEFFDFVIELHHPDIAVCSHKKTDSKKEEEVGQFYLKKKIGIDSVPRILVEFAWERAYKKEIIKDIRFDENLKFNEDRMFNLDVLQNAEKELIFSYSDIQLYYYYTNPNGLIYSGGYNPECIKKLVDSIRQRTELCKNNNKSLYVTQGIKLSVSYRHLSGKNGRTKENLRWYKDTMRYFIPLLRASEHISTKKKIQYLALGKFPFIYSIAMKVLK